MALPRQTSPATGVSDRLAGGMGSVVEAQQRPEPRLLDLEQFSPEDLAQFAGGMRSILTVLPQERILDLYEASHQLGPADMTPGEMLITYDVMHNSVTEAIASVHARDAMAFANDVMINLVQIERLQQNNQDVSTTYNDWEDDDESDPQKREEKRQEKLRQALDNIFQQAQEERLEQQRKEWQAQWDKDMHNVAGLQISGAQLHAMWQYLQDPANVQNFEQSLMDKYHVSKEEAEKRRKMTQEYLDLLEKQRRGETLTAEEKKRMQELNDKPWMQDTMHDLQEANKIQGASYHYTKSSASTGQRDGNDIKSTSSRINMLEQLKTNGADLTTRSAPPIAVAEANVSAQDNTPWQIAQTGLDDLMGGRSNITAEPLKPEFTAAATEIPINASVDAETKVAALPQQPSPQLGGLMV